ncbi:MAG: hypothetical protein ACKVJK_01470 [Methylophagaceae bacterium]|jgi:uncharacterized protein YgfB (UPF0149 family)|tara:strand:- start:9987 stop:10196 length:210 start_codon:yes stop_codon:yes gene_type:complete
MSSINDLEIVARSLKSLLDDGELTESEFDELIQDLIDVTKIEEDIDLEDNKIKLEKAVNAVKAIANIII